jgi:hypothetical protein
MDDTAIEEALFEAQVLGNAAEILQNLVDIHEEMIDKGEIPQDEDTEELLERMDTTIETCGMFAHLLFEKADEKADGDAIDAVGFDDTDDDEFGDGPTAFQ